MENYNYYTEYKDDKGKLKSIYYSLNGICHRTDGPAHVYYFDNDDGYKEIYFIHGTIHRDSGPAIINYYSNGNVESESYYANGKLHRLDGPAIIRYDLVGLMVEEFYYILAQRVTKKQFYTPGFIDALILENS
jgi:antitoxin component YwqK of YwqJK toxin-antitoxin module